MPSDNQALAALADWKFQSFGEEKHGKTVQNATLDSMAGTKSRLSQNPYAC